MKIRDPQEANEYLEALIKELMEWSGRTALECSEAVRHDIATYALSYPLATRYRVQCLFRAFSPSGDIITPQDIERDDRRANEWRSYYESRMAEERQRQRLIEHQITLAQMQAPVIQVDSEIARRMRQAAGLEESEVVEPKKSKIKIEPPKKGRVFDLE